MFTHSHVERTIHVDWVYSKPQLQRGKSKLPGCLKSNKLKQVETPLKRQIQFEAKLRFQLEQDKRRNSIETK